MNRFVKFLFISKRLKNELFFNRVTHLSTVLSRMAATIINNDQNKMYGHFADTAIN